VAARVSPKVAPVCGCVVVSINCSGSLLQADNITSPEIIKNIHDLNFCCMLIMIQNLFDKF
jgi:hypothetical protein